MATRVRPETRKKFKNLAKAFAREKGRRVTPSAYLEIIIEEHIARKEKAA